MTRAGSYSIYMPFFDLCLRFCRILIFLVCAGYYCVMPLRDLCRVLLYLPLLCSIFSFLTLASFSVASLNWVGFYSNFSFFICASFCCIILLLVLCTDSLHIFQALAANSAPLHVWNLRYIPLLDLCGLCGIFPSLICADHCCAMIPSLTSAGFRSARVWLGQTFTV